MTTLTSRKMRVLALGCAASGILLIAGCRQDMQNQPKLIPQRGSAFFADGRGARPQVLNTVDRDQLHEDSYFYTGLVPGPDGKQLEQDLMPFPATLTVLERGQERFNIYCSPCHSKVGNGMGAIVERGYKLAGNFHDDLRRHQKLSHYFYVMSHGYGAMPDYSAQLAPADRWAVAAYIRALQLSQAAEPKDVPAGVQVKDLRQIAIETGTPVDYANPWPLPTTAVQSYPADKKQGTPGMAPAYPADPTISVPMTNLPPQTPSKSMDDMSNKQNSKQPAQR